MELHISMIVISANIIVTRLIKLCWFVACVIHNIVDKQINVNNNMPILFINIDLFVYYVMYNTSNKPA